MTRTFPRMATTSPTAPLQLLHVDICGPISVPGLAGEKYFFTIVDGFTRWTNIIPLVTKSDAADDLKNFITASESFFSPLNLKVAAVRSDNGGEFCNANLKSYFMDKGIAHQLTVPYNSSQNGLAERKHRTIQEKSRTLLHESGLSLNTPAMLCLNTDEPIRHKPKVTN
jgi:transposase InsO family protein